jgi:uncharacterized protein YndB with AHSA1/START domain/predicted enzyme related to lactoylglutathione lyase
MIRAIDVVYYPARDWSGLLRWYSEALTGQSSYASEGQWAELRLPLGEVTFAVSRAADGKSQPGAAFSTDDLETDCRRLVESGATLIGEPIDVGPSVVASMRDPEGNGFYLVESKRGNVALLEQSIEIEAGIERVWTQVRELKSWLGCSLCQFEPTTGSTWSASWAGGAHDGRKVQGTVVEVAPYRRVALTWRQDGWEVDTEVEIALEYCGPEATRVAITHRGFDRLPMEVCLPFFEAQCHSWTEALDRLAALVEPRSGGGTTVIVA